MRSTFGEASFFLRDHFWITRVFLFAWAFLVFFLCPACAFAAQPPQREITVAVLDETRPSDRMRFVEETADYLERALSGVRWKFVYLDEGSHLKATESGEAQFFIRFASIYGTMKRQGAQALASMRPASGCGNAREALAVAVVVRTESGIQRIGDLKGRRISSTVPQDFGGEAPVLAEAALQGFDPERFFGAIFWKGRLGAGEILEDVVDGRADAGLIPSGYLEAKARETGEGLPPGLWVLPAQDDDGLADAHSTHAYPGLYFWASRSADEDDIRAVMSVLLDMPVNDRGESWTVPAAFNTINGMQRLARIGPYAHLREWSLQRIWSEHSLLVVSLGLTLLFVLLHGVLAERLVKKRTAQVVRAMEEKRRKEDELRIEREKLDSLEKAGLIGQLSTLIAHELKQPLSSIISISRGLSRKADERAIEAEERGGEESEALLELCDEVETQLGVVSREALRASSILDAVRDHAKDAGELPERLDFEAAVRSLALKFGRLAGAKCAVAFEGSAGGAFVTVRKLELELVLFNLIRNSVQACPAGAQAKIVLAFETGSGWAGFRIEDNGPTLSEERLLSLSRFTAKSTRKGGLGVGLGLVRSLAESYGGRVLAERSAGGGLAVSVRLPCADRGRKNEGEEDEGR